MTIAALRKRSREVATTAEETEGAFALARGENLLLLQEIAEAAKEALPSICSKVPASGRGKPGKPIEDRSWFNWRGVLLIGKLRPSPERKDVHGLEEVREERSLFLAEDGAYRIVEYEARFLTEEAGDDVSWDAINLPGAKLDKWPAQKVLESLLAEIDVQVEGKKKSAAKAREVAADLRACLACLRGNRGKS